jgi:hypothetical protein
MKPLHSHPNYSSGPRRARWLPALCLYLHPCWIGLILAIPQAIHADIVTLTYDLTSNLTVVQTATPAVPTIVSQPVSVLLADLNSSVSFSVDVSSSSPVTYQWKFNGKDIAGATGDTLFLPSVTLDNAGSYTVVITNALGSTTSAAGILTIRDNPEVVQWGLNNYGQTNVPAGLHHVMAIATGGNHSLALRTDGTVVAWGWDAYGQAETATVWR